MKRPAPKGDREIELKFSVPLEQANDAFWAPLGRRLGRSGSKQLENTYFDTPDRRLMKRRVGLRIRKSGDRLLQTLKDEGDGIARFEWERPVRSKSPELDAVADEEARARLGFLLASELEPVFETHFERKSREIEVRGDNGQAAIVEVCRDLGAITTRDAGSEIAEIELELKSGPAHLLFDAALKLVAACDARIETRSKAARGYALASDSGPVWTKAETIRLDPKATVADCARLTLAHCRVHWWRNLAAAADGSDPEGVHQLRVALRRLRTLLTLFKTLIPADDMAWLQSEARHALRALGAARDLDVFATEILPPIARGAGEHASLTPLEGWVATARADAQNAVLDTLGHSRHATFLLSFAKWHEEGEWLDRADPAIASMPIRDFARKALTKRHKAVLKRGQNFETLDETARHEVRIALKKLRYALDFFRSVFEAKQAKPYLKHAAALQEGFGTWNDLAAAELLVTQIRSAVPDDPKLAQACGFVSGWLGHRRLVAEPELIASWHAFCEDRPFWKKS
ncbi:MAG: CHAD domain-containing protein [Geminicoccaceae bacterium]